MDVLSKYNIPVLIVNVRLCHLRTCAKSTELAFSFLKEVFTHYIFLGVIAGSYAKVFIGLLLTLAFVEVTQTRRFRIKNIRRPTPLYFIHRMTSLSFTNVQKRQKASKYSKLRFRSNEKQEQTLFKDLRRHGH